MNQPKSKLTPIQVLTCEKQRLIRRCDQQEQLVGEHLNYIQQNAGSLIIHGVKSILFPPIPLSKSSPTSYQNTNIGLDSYLSQIKGYMPLLWEVTRPLLVSWGINKFRRNLKTLLGKL